MSEAQWFVRARGRVQGPFNLQQLRALRDRGWLGRFDQVSEDRASWGPAESVPDLFGASAPPAPAAVQAPAPVSTPVPIPGPAPCAAWFYRDPNGQPSGPHSREKLLNLLVSGQVSQRTMVWSDGMSAWQPLSATELADAIPDLGITPQDAALGRVRIGVTMLTITKATDLGMAGLVFVIILASGWGFINNPSGLFALEFSAGLLIGLVLAGLTILAVRILNAVAYGLCMSIPPLSGNRNLAITCLILEIATLLLRGIALLTFALPGLGSVMNVLHTVVAAGSFLLGLFFIRTMARAAAPHSGLSRSCSAIIVTFLLQFGLFLIIEIVLMIALLMGKVKESSLHEGAMVLVLSLSLLLLLLLGLAIQVWHSANLFYLRGWLRK